jgi:hypothetical protein
MFDRLPPICSAQKAGKSPASTTGRFFYAGFEAVLNDAEKK